MAKTLQGGAARSAGDRGFRRGLAALRARARSPGFRNYVRDLLLELCRVDTTPKPDVALMRAAEDRCFQILARELAAMNFSGERLERRPVLPDIQRHPAYSLLHFTKTHKRPNGLTPAEAYRDRSNLVCLIPGTGRSQGGEAIAVNGHIDVVAPYFGPRVRGGTVYGRGACDDKGPVVGIVAGLKLLAGALGNSGLNRNLLAMFVVEEETGGNGSLSLATDRELKQHYKSVMVCECTGLKIHPANRGAVWYRAELTAPMGTSPLELYSFINEQMEEEGAAIRAESRHELFPQRPVQTCHGILGPFGEHPSRICGEATFTIDFPARPGKAAADLVRDCLEAGLARYTGLYGDKTKVLDPKTRRPIVARHYDLRTTARGFQIEVHGATGHMGAIRERDGAITKMAHMVRAMVNSKARLEALGGGPVRIELAGNPPQNGGARGTTLVCEGGQGFVPTHGMDEIMARLRRAAERGAENYLRQCGRTETGDQVVKVAYEKLHNAAYASDPNSATMRRAVAAARTCGLPESEPVLGWTVSCDARLFATEYPGMPVLTFGPGQLTYAHSDQEQIEIEDIVKAAEFLALFLLNQTGTRI